MDTTIPATEPNTGRAAVARAWQQGTRLARLLHEHDVPRPEYVSTSHYKTGDGQGQTHVWARMRSAADLFRLAYRTDRQLSVCATSEHNGNEQAYLDLGYSMRRQIVVCWTGPVSGGAA